ncbi:putative methionyl aminopeptidase [Helianthus anomalus]
MLRLLSRPPDPALVILNSLEEALLEMFIKGVWRDRMWPDGWTAVTADGKRSAQFEHTLLVWMFGFRWFNLSCLMF